MTDIKTILTERQLDTDCDTLQNAIDSVSDDDVRRQLAQSPGKYSFQRLLTLISPQAQNHLEQMEKETASLIEEAAEYAKACPFPQPEETLSDLFAD